MRPAATTAQRTARLLAGLAIAGLMAYGVFLLARRIPAVGGMDSAGYANTAQALLRGRIGIPIQGLDELGLPDRFGPALMEIAYSPGPRPRTMVPFYPPGLPMHMALASWLAGPRAVYVVSPLAAVCCVWLMFLLGRELGLARPLAAAGAAVLAACPVFLFQAIQPMSDVVATLWALAAIVAALRARGDDRWALAAGAALGMAVLVRHTNAMLVLPLGAAIPWRRSTLARVAAGALPFAIFFLAWNRAVTGAPLRTGYGTLLDTALSLSNFGVRFRHYKHWVIAQLSPLLALGWLAVPADRRIPWRDRLLLVVWFVPFLILYSCWLSYNAWWYTRFLLPAFPALIAGALLVGRDLMARAREWRVPRWIRTAIALLLLAVVAHAEWQSGRLVQPFALADKGRVFANGCRALANAVGTEKALVVSMEFSGAVRFVNGLAPLRWDMISPADFAVVRERAVEKGYAIYAALLRGEVESMRQHAPGRWTPVARIEGGAVLLKLESGPAPACPRTSYTDDPPIPVATFREKNARCAPTDDATWLACDNAIYLLCRDRGCLTGGIGALEWAAGGAATAACLSAADPARDVTAAELAPFGACPWQDAPPIAARFQCAGAIHGYCTSLGYESGFGPVGSPAPGTWSVVCLKPDSARTVATTYPELAKFHDACASQASAVATPSYCMSAAKRLCVDRGYAAGFGPVVDRDGQTPTIVCLDD